MHLWVCDAIDDAKDVPRRHMQVRVHLRSVVLECIFERFPIDGHVSPLDLGFSRGLIVPRHVVPPFTVDPGALGWEACEQGGLPTSLSFTCHTSFGLYEKSNKLGSPRLPKCVNDAESSPTLTG